MKKIKDNSKASFFMLTALFLSFFFGVSPVHANDSQKSEAELTGATGFTYSIIFPDNQMEQNIGYYQLKMEPEQEQEITIVLSNPGAEKTTVNVGLNGAKTNQNGVIEYGESPIKNDPSLIFDFKEIVKGPESIELAAGETKNLVLKIKMPKTSFKGKIAGGIQLMRANQESATEDKGGSKIVNQYAYVIGLILQESDEELAPDLKLNTVSASQNNYRNTVFVNVSNVKATYLNDMTIETQITKKGSSAVLYERKQTAMRMAPNSFLNFPISMNGESMVAGKYGAKILVTSGDQKWTWTEEFDISQEDADKFNERDVGLVQEKGIDWIFILAIVAAVLVVSALVFTVLLISRKKRQKKEYRKQQKKRDKKKEYRKQQKKDHIS